MNTILEIIGSLALLGSGFFGLIAGLGLLRFRDLASRMHAATKASGAALILVLTSVCLREAEVGTVVKALIAIAFAFLTLPVAAHLLGRAAVYDPKDRHESNPTK